MVIKRGRQQWIGLEKGWVLTSVFDDIPFNAVVVTNFVINRSGVMRRRGAAPAFSPLVRIITLVAVRSSIGLVIRVLVIVVILPLAPTRSIVILRIESSVRHERTATWTMNTTLKWNFFIALSNRPKRRRQGTLGIGALRWQLEVSFIRPQTHVQTDEFTNRYHQEFS